MKYSIAAIVSICLSLIACGSDTTETKPESVNATLSNSNNTNAYVAASPNTSAVNVVSANGNHAILTGPPPNARPLTYAAPDNSTYAVEMGGSGFPVETRTFTSNKYISKVVRSWQDPTKKKISIYLKSGKVIRLPGEKWPDIKSQPISAFYEAAGIKPAENASAEPKRKTEQQP